MKNLILFVLVHKGFSFWSDSWPFWLKSSLLFSCLKIFAYQWHVFNLGEPLSFQLSTCGAKNFICLGVSAQSKSQDVQGAFGILMPSLVCGLLAFFSFKQCCKTGRAVFIACLMLFVFLSSTRHCKSISETPVNLENLNSAMTKSHSESNFCYTGCFLISLWAISLS